jgi:TPP-dependent pyruvate/acetoin dehydrogenase alpha subunit
VSQPEPQSGAPTALELYDTMTRIRRFEVTAERLQATGRIESGLHLSIGQEAVAAGVCHPMRSTDLITSTHRGHGHCLAKGGQLAPMLGELFAKSGGYCGGKSGSMHIADAGSGILGANAIVGGGIPIALGAAFAIQQQGRDDVAATFFGEGAAAEGVFHESLNIAALWRLPILFVCENNGYAEMTPVSVHLAAAGVADFGAPYGIPAVSVDGNDVFAVLDSAAQAIDRARSGGGPTILECRTYRWRGHYQGDPETYRTRDEVDEWSARDPLVLLRARHSELASDFDGLDAKADHDLATAVEEVAQWTDPGPDALLEHVYSTPNGSGASR